MELTFSTGSNHALVHDGPEITLILQHGERIIEGNFGLLPDGTQGRTLDRRPCCALRNRGKLTSGYPLQ
jgi:hypothetical protein